LALKITGLIGLGIVWGWWTAPWADVRARGWAAMMVVAAVALQGIETVWVLGFRSLLPLLAGWLIGFLLHRALRTALRMRLRQRTTT